MARAEAGRCFRCDIVETCATVHVLGGRGPDDRPATAAGSHPPMGSPIGDQPTTAGGAA
jgi:hypothetical protein